MRKFAQAIMDADIVLPVPHVLAAVLALAAGAAQVVQLDVLVLPAAWHAYIGLGLVVVSYLGIKPLVGPAFREALKLPPAVSQAITAAVTVATVVLGQVTNIPHVAQVILATATTVLLALGFGPAGSAIVASSRRRRLRSQHVPRHVADEVGEA